MYIVSNKAGESIEADYVMQGRQFPVLHIHTRKCTPIHAYELFQEPEKSEKITAVEVHYTPTHDEEFSDGKTYYELDGLDYVPTMDTEKNPEKTYFEEEIGVPVVYNGFTKVHSVQESPFLTEYGEILIWLQKG